jgi:fructoselysine-6-P-deglycase FrlB-like protein
MSDIEREIATQPVTWREAAALARSIGHVLPARDRRMAVIGCGTSHFMAQSFAALRESGGWGETDAFPASEMPTARPYDLVVAISRSGRTTEVVRALERLPRETSSLVITAVAGSPVTRAAGTSLVMDFADERSIVQTRFATGALALLRALLGHDIDAAADDAEMVLAEPPPVEAAAFEHFVFLGRGWTVGLANEAALKLREAAGAWSESYPAMEYRHGPVSLAGPATLVTAFGPVEHELLAEVAATGATVLHDGLDPMAELITAQRTAVALARARGLDPDHPRHLSRSVVLP